MHEAAARLWPERALVTHLHGTELKMLDRVGRLEAVAVGLDTGLDRLADVVDSGEVPHGCRVPETDRELLRRTNLSRYRYGKDWAARLEASARHSRRIICISPHDASVAARLLGVPGDLIEVIPNGVDTDLFDRSALTPDERLKLLRHWLVDDPQGWDESGCSGASATRSMRWMRHESRRRAASASPVRRALLDFKRVPLLVRAYARARPRFETPVPLLIWGGSPGEWEGEHPYTVARELIVDGVFFSGWRGHDELPLGLSLCRRVRRPFGRRALRAGFPRGDVVWSAGDHNVHRWTRLLRQHHRREAERLARRAGRRRCPCRSARRSGQR